MRMFWFQMAKIIDIPEGAANADESKVLRNYLMMRALKRERVWYPCHNGWLCFGKDATDYGIGMQTKYFGVPMCFTDTPPDKEWKIKLNPAKIAPTGPRNKTDLLLLKLFKILK